MYPIVDTHTHLYYNDEEDTRLDFSADISDVIARAQSAGVILSLLPNIDKETYPQMMSLSKCFPAHCLPMVGVHPTNIEADWREQLDFLHGELSTNPSQFIAIGEIGLDYHWGLEYKKEMRHAFMEQLEWALEYKLPVSVHSRDAEDDVLDILAEYDERGVTGSIHSFGGNHIQAQRAVGECPHFMIGVNGVVTFKNSMTASILPQVVPLDRVIIETDAPFLAPTPNRGKRNEPSNLIYIVQKLSQVYGASIEEVRRQLFVNSVKLFKLHTQTAQWL